MIDYPGIHHRHSIRLRDYDYMQAGAYFITICTFGRDCLFGDVIDGTVSVNELGRCVELTWFDLPRHNSHVSLDAFIVMPNHIHGIIVFNNYVGAGSEPAPTEPAPTKKMSWIARNCTTIEDIFCAPYQSDPQFARCARMAAELLEHIIRNDDEMNRIHEYIIHNSLKWETDRDHPKYTK